MQALVCAEARDSLAKELEDEEEANQPVPGGTERSNMGKGMRLNMCVQTMVSTGRVIEVEEAWLVWRASIRARNCNSLNGLNRQKGRTA